MLFFPPRFVVSPRRELLEKPNIGVQDFRLVFVCVPPKLFFPNWSVEAPRAAEFGQFSAERSQTNICYLSKVTS